jgi:hypothetical protein
MFLNHNNHFDDIPNKVRYTSTHIFICFAATTAELGAVYKCLEGALNATSYLLFHAGIVAAVGIVILTASRFRQDLGVLSLLFVTTLLTGPFGAMGCFITSVYLALLRYSPRRLDAWYRRISGSVGRDAASVMYDAIHSGRQSIEDTPSTLSFLEVLETGSLGQKQIMLGVIARNFDEGFLPILGRALRSPDAAMRVQAAAIANRLSREQRDKIW